MRELVVGTRVNDIAQSERRYPGWRVLLHNPRCTTPSQVATDTYTVPPLDITAYVQDVTYEENVGFENGENPSTTQITVTLRRHPETGLNIRRGLIDDGVIVQVLAGDIRVEPEDWPCIFTGTFRGFPADDPGTPADKSEGLKAVAHGREEAFLNLKIEATPSFPAGTDLGEIATFVATDETNGMGLVMDEILFGNLGFVTKHVVSQIVDLNCLTALWNLGFPVGKKPKFDSKGRLRFVDVNLDKPAVRIYADRALFQKIVAAPNELEVNNSVVVTGLDSVMTKAKGMSQLLDTFDIVTGFFDYEFKENKWFSQDHSQRAENTFLLTKHAITWSSADYHQVDEFHGRVDVDCHTLFAARLIIFTTYLATQIAVAALDLLMQTDPSIGDTIIVDPGLGPDAVITVAALRSILYVLSVVALAGLLWSMQFIGRGTYELHGEPYEFVYQELMVRAKMIGLRPEQIRELTYRNDFIDSIDALEVIALEQLRREMLKNQTFEIEMMDDPLLEVDDIIEIAGDRYYITGVSRTLQRDKDSASLMSLKVWRIFRDVIGDACAVPGVPTNNVPGYGGGYGQHYGKEL